MSLSCSPDYAKEYRAEETAWRERESKRLAANKKTPVAP